MSFVVSALNVLHTVLIFAAEGDEEFDPNNVTSGPAGFVATAVMAIAVISLGVLLVRRLRRNQYRSEARAAIAEELAAQDAASGAAGDAAYDAAHDAADQPEATNGSADKPTGSEGGEG